ELQRSLLVDLFLTDSGVLHVFLVPLWSRAVPEIERIRLGHGHIERLAGDLLAATSLNVRSGTRGIRSAGGTAVLSGSQLERTIDQMSGLVEPWASRLDDWKPSELIVSTHSHLNLLPFHAASDRGIPL